MVVLGLFPLAPRRLSPPPAAAVLADLLPHRFPAFAAGFVVCVRVVFVVRVCGVCAGVLGTLMLDGLWRVLGPCGLVGYSCVLWNSEDHPRLSKSTSSKHSAAEARLLKAPSSAFDFTALIGRKKKEKVGEWCGPRACTPTSTLKGFNLLRQDQSITTIPSLPRPSDRGGLLLSPWASSNCPV